jgi:hypothetical protein
VVIAAVVVVGVLGQSLNKGLSPPIIFVECFEPELGNSDLYLGNTLMTSLYYRGT